MTIEKDKELEQLFNNFKPSLSNSDRFIKTLNSRLELVESMKQIQTAQARRYKLSILAAFIAGFIASLFALNFVIFMPTTAPIFTFNIHTAPFMFITQNSHIITLIVISSITASSIFGLAYNITTLPTIMSKNLKKVTSGMSLDKIV